MMKLKNLLFVCVLLVTGQAGAEQGVVIDMNSMGGASAAAAAEPTQTTGGTTAPDKSALEAQSEENKERVLKGGKLSRHQKAALIKAKLGESNLTEGEEFLENNKSKPGVVVLPNGVQYKVLRAGKKGKKPVESSTVMCRFKGTLIDGSLFDKSDDKKASKLKVSDFIPGLSSTIKLMSVGAKWEIVIPPSLGHGDKGDRGVGPNAVLVYELELVSIR